MPCLLLAAVCLVLVTVVVARSAVHERTDPGHWERVRGGGRRLPGVAGASTGVTPPPPPGGGTYLPPVGRPELELDGGGFDVAAPPEWPPQSGLNDAPSGGSDLLNGGDSSWR